MKRERECLIFFTPSRKEGDALSMCILGTFFGFFLLIGWLGMTWHIAAEVLTQNGASNLDQGFKAVFVVRHLVLTYYHILLLLQ